MRNAARQPISSLHISKTSFNSRASSAVATVFLHPCRALPCETPGSDLCMSFYRRGQRRSRRALLFSFVSPLSLNCNVVWCWFSVLVSFFPVCLSDRDVFSLLVSDSCADWSRSPLAHGCRSTHNSPVHSACSSQRLSQNFSVSVPTLIFTGTKAGKTEGE